jgi:hypothetical protein
MPRASPTTVRGHVADRLASVWLGLMRSRRELAFSTCQSRRTTASPSPCLDTLRTSLRAHAVAPHARAAQSFAQPLRGTRPTGPSQRAWQAPFSSRVHQTAMRSKLLNREIRLGRAGRGGRRPGIVFGLSATPQQSNERYGLPTSNSEACLVAPH